MLELRVAAFIVTLLGFMYARSVADELEQDGYRRGMAVTPSALSGGAILDWIERR